MQFFPNSGALKVATLLRANLAASSLRLFKSEFVPTVSSTLAEYAAAEADYTGYPVGGAPLATWFAAVLNPAGGASIDSPTVQFTTVAPYTVGNLIGGWFLTNDEDETVIAAGTFANPIPLGAANQGFPMNVTLVFPNGV